MQESESGQLEKALRLQAERVGFEAVVPTQVLRQGGSGMKSPLDCREPSTAAGGRSKADGRPRGRRWHAARKRSTSVLFRE